MFWWDDYIYKKIENLDKYGFFEEVEYEGQETVGSRFVIHKEEKADGLKRIIRTNSSWWAEKNYKDQFKLMGWKRIIRSNSSWWAEKNYKDQFINRHQGLKRELFVDTKDWKENWIYMEFEKAIV